MGVAVAGEIGMEEPGFASDFTDNDIVHHVRNALLSVRSGDEEGYQQLLGVLHHSQRLAPDEVALLMTSLKALSGAVSCIDNTYHDLLLNCIFGMKVWHYGPDVMDALLELIIALAASDGKYVDSSLHMLVSNFVPPPYLIDMLSQPRGQLKKDQVLSRVHSTLEAIVDLVPMAALRLSSIVIHRMPITMKRDLGNQSSKDQTQMFVENMLRINSGPMKEIVGGRMLMAVVDILVDLDVAIGWDEILKDDSSKGMFTVELEEEPEANDSDLELNFNEDLPSILSQKSIGKNAVADMLDSLMVSTCEHLELCATNQRLPEVFETLLDSFMATVLLTYKSKFAQFVMFYACALDPDICGLKFATTLTDRFICGDNPLTRMSAVSYLASYLARAKFVSLVVVTAILKRLVDWCLEYTQSRSKKAQFNPKGHKVFYSGCQAIMYILCFRMRSIMDAPKLRTQFLKFRLEEILQNGFEPLRVCLPSIVEEFLKQAKAARIPCSWEGMSFEESDLSKDFGGNERLDMFFPFDPCLLKKCDRSFIRPHYVYWNQARATYDEDEDSSDDEVMEIHNEEEAHSFDDFEHAMNAMSITPKDADWTFSTFASKLQMPYRLTPSTTP